jgi:hypothetical protein
MIALCALLGARIRMRRRLRIVMKKHSLLHSFLSLYLRIFLQLYWLQFARKATFWSCLKCVFVSNATSLLCSTFLEVKQKTWTLDLCFVDMYRVCWCVETFVFTKSWNLDFTSCHFLIDYALSRAHGCYCWWNWESRLHRCSFSLHILRHLCDLRSRK